MMPPSAQDMGFFDTIGRGWKMSKLSMAVVKKDPELMVYVFLSGVMALGAMVAMGLPEFLNMGWARTDEGKMTPAYMGFLFGGYMGISIIITFWNSAIVANAYIRLNGGDPKFVDGFGAAFKRIHLIIMWGIIAGTVGLLLKVLKEAAREQKGGAAVLVMILQIIGATIWWIMSFFVIPLMVIEGIGVGESMKRSKQMFMKTWGENVTSGMGIGIITAFFALIILVIGVVLSSALGELWYIGAIVGAIAMVILIMWSSAAEQVAVAALYIFSTTGKMPGLYQEMGMNDFKMQTGPAPRRL